MASATRSHSAAKSAEVTSSKVSAPPSVPAGAGPKNSTATSGPISSSEAPKPPTSPTAEPSDNSLPPAALKGKGRMKPTKPAEDELYMKDVCGDEKMDQLGRDVMKLQGQYKDLEHKITFCIEGIHRILTKLDSAKLNRTAFGRPVDPIVAAAVGDIPVPSASKTAETVKPPMPATSDKPSQDNSLTAPAASTEMPTAKKAISSTRATRSKPSSSEGDAGLLLQLDSPLATPIDKISASTKLVEPNASFKDPTVSNNGRPPESMIMVFDVVPAAKPQIVWEDESDDTSCEPQKSGEKRKAAAPSPAAPSELKLTDKRQCRPNLPTLSTQVLKNWLKEHSGTPYPTEEEKASLCNSTGLSLMQINNWFSNARRRLLKKHEVEEDLNRLAAEAEAQPRKQKPKQ